MGSNRKKETNTAQQAKEADRHTQQAVRRPNRNAQDIVSPSKFNTKVAVMNKPPEKPITEEQTNWDDEPPEWQDEEPAKRVESDLEFARGLETKTYDEFHGRKHGKAKFDGAWKPEYEESLPFDTIDASSWHGQQRPVREFLDQRKLIPFGYATNLSGAGAVGKTLIALQASVACVTGSRWLGAEIRKGPVLFYSAEEPLVEMHIRLDEICEAENMHLDRLKGLFIIDLNKVADASLITGNNKTGTVSMTGLFKRLELTIDKIKPVVVFLDNRGLLVTGNENDRTIASMAMRSLQLLAEKYQCAIVLLSHPSLTGLNTGTGSSGSTAWFNTGRSTIYMSKPDDAEDEDVRVLENNKANYAKHGTKVNLKWTFNRFVCTDPAPSASDAVGKDDKAERVFMKLLRWHSERGLHLSAKLRSPQFAPNIFNDHPGREGLNITWFKKAMAGLFERQTIKLAERRIDGRMMQVIEEVLI